MRNQASSLRCYIASTKSDHIDPFLEREGFGHGLVMFAAPEIGLMFRCRAEGEHIDLEFGAFFSLLKFLKTYLVKDAVSELFVYSSNPEFVMSFRPNSRLLAKGSTREVLLREYLRDYRIQVGFVEPQNNRCLISPIEYPSLPEGFKTVLKPNVRSDKRTEFKPFQRGIRL